MAREMKDSGVEWIGKMPKEWKSIRLKKLAKIQTGNTPSKTEKKIKYFCDDNESGFLWIKPNNLNGFNYINNSDEKLTEEGKKVAKIAPKNSILVCCIGSIGKFGILENDSAFNQQINSVTFNKKIYSKFGLYLISSSESQHWLYANGNVIKILNNEGQGKIILPVPSLKEQEKIANYLDKKISDIDLIIEKTKTTIEDYKKYKQSIITETVTKGLNPNVEMKDSEIEWIGKIPKHWEVSRIQHLFEVIDERNTNPNAQLLSLYTAIGVKPRADLEEKGNKAVTVINYKKVKINDIIVNKLLAWMGAIGYSDYEGVTSPDYDVYRAKKDKPVNRNFFNNYFRYTQFKGDCFKYGYGIMLMRWRTYSEQFLRLKVPVPPLEEQQQIAEYLDKKVAEIDNLIAKKESLISEMEEYKKSLIYECVTGKKEII